MKRKPSRHSTPAIIIYRVKAYDYLILYKSKKLQSLSLKECFKSNLNESCTLSPKCLRSGHRSQVVQVLIIRVKCVRSVQGSVLVITGHRLITPVLVSSVNSYHGGKPSSLQTGGWGLWLRSEGCAHHRNYRWTSSKTLLSGNYLTSNFQISQVRMAHTWLSSSWTRATPSMASSGEAPLSTPAGSPIFTMTRGS